MPLVPDLENYSDQEISLLAPECEQVLTNGNSIDLLFSAINSFGRFKSLREAIDTVEEDSISPDILEKIRLAYGLYKFTHNIIFIKIPSNEAFPLTNSSTCLTPLVKNFTELYESLKADILKNQNIDKIQKYVYSSEVKNSATSILLKHAWLPMTLLSNLVKNNSENYLLVIDVRPRIRFNVEHIESLNIICIEPMYINGFSSLQDIRLIEDQILLPVEKLLFRNMTSFQYIVLYTQDEEDWIKRTISLLVILANGFSKSNLSDHFPSLFISIIDFLKWHITHNIKSKRSVLFPTKNQGKHSSEQFKDNFQSQMLLENEFAPTELKFIAGLENHENSCYLNCIIQCILGIEEIVLLLISNKYLKLIKRNNGITWNCLSLLAKSMKIASFYGPNSANYTAVTVKEFKNCCGSINSDFSRSSQEDCCYFYQFLLGTLSDEITPPDTESKYNFVTTLMLAQITSQLTCKKCYNYSLTREDIFALSLPVPDSNTCDVTDCLKMFTKCETLDFQNRWYCPNCQRKQHSTKQLLISKLPKYMVIHLKRFNNNLGKNNCFVNYAQSLNFTMFTTKELNGKEPNCMTYKLFAVACHNGSLNNGHYTAYVNKDINGGWVKFDDTIQRPIKPLSEFICKEAYLLFYCKSY